ncbi:restriction endonuclease subunit S [Levilactobacillus yiduensis]|uniref:restriction endonuclease subunit S n=1 Tax=Levilactobacillus yiduensis TaxID=2953880 RepID=UPI0021577625|nr:restriction endonuclease subunit S [Levilactobacillus yiduensis]
MKDNQAKYPQLRFKGFTDPWEKRTLGQTTTKAKSYSLSRDVERDHETGYRYIHYGDIHTGVADIVTEHTKLPNIEPANYDELRVNDLVVADASEDYQGIAEPAVVVGLPTHLVAGLHTITLRPSSASSLYLYYLLHTDSFKHFGYQMGTGLKVFGISWSNLSKFTFMIPSRPEQEMIVKLIESVDNLIAVNQRKLDLLKEQKKGYLQKMFPKNGAKVPELRFAGFADDWEERKLSDVANHRGGTAIEKYFDKDGVYKVISIGSYGLNSQYVDQNIRAISNEITDGRVVNSGELTMVLNDKTANGTIIGRTLLVEKDNEYVINQRTEIISPKENFDSNFAYTILNGPFREKVKRIVQGGTQIYVNYPAVSNLNLELPKIEEQQKIGSFFKQLDDTIALHQRKLEKLQELKKGYLQKMFC